MDKNKVIFGDGIVRFERCDGLIQQLTPLRVYCVFGADTVTFKLTSSAKENGLCILTSKAENLEVDGITYGIGELPLVLEQKFAESGAVARVEIVQDLPTIGKGNILYLVYTDVEGVFDEYIWLDDENRFEDIGTTSIRLSDYLLKRDFWVYSADTEDCLDAISGKVDSNAEVTSAALNDLNGRMTSEYYTKDNVDEMFSSFLLTIFSSVNTTVPANDRKNVIFDSKLPEGYEFGAYRQVSIQNLTGSGANDAWKKCVIQSFSTSGNGNKCNINIVNTGDVEAKINISCKYLVYKKM